MWQRRDGGIRSCSPGKERWQTRVNNITVIKDSCLTSAYCVSILDRGKDPFFTNTFHDSRGVPIPGPRGPPGPVGECWTCFMDVYTVYWICICIINLRLSVFLDMCSKTDDKQFQTSTRWRLLVLIWILIFYIRPPGPKGPAGPPGPSGQIVS